MKTKKTDEIRRKIVLFFMSFTLCLLQSCSTEEVVLESESNSKTRDYSVKKISFLDLKNINNQVFIESAKLKKVFSIDKNKTVNSISNYDIDLQNIQYLKRTNNDETFSFRIYQVPTATFLQNIVVECKEKSKPQTYLVTYYLNKQANQINNSNDFIRAIKSTSIIKIENQFKTHRTTSGGCLQVGYYEEVDACEGELDTRPRCYNSDGTRATINVFKVIDSACSTGAGPTDFIPMAAQWNFYNTAPSNPNYQNTGSGTGTGTNSGGETIDINIFAPNYFEGGDLSDPAVQNRLRVNQFMTTLYNSSNEIKNVVDTTEWLMPYTNYWIGSNGGLTPSNQNTMTFAFNAIPTLFNQYYGTTYEPSQIANFKFSVFQFLLFHGGFLSNLDPITQKSILDGLTSFEQIAFENEMINYMMENPGVTRKLIENWFMGTSEGQDGEYDADLNNVLNTLTYQKRSLPSYTAFQNNFPKLYWPEHPYYYQTMPANSVYSLVGGNLQSLYLNNAQDKGPYKNACAVRISLALNKIGVSIPDNAVTRQGASIGSVPQYYFLQAIAINDFMIKTFGDTTYKLEGAAANNKTEIAKLLEGKNGIYVIVNNDGTTAGYTGHADLIKNGYVIGGANTTPKGGVKSIRIWILN